MSFAIFFPIFLGMLAIASIFLLGIKYNWSGLEAISIYCVGIVLFTLIIGLVPQKQINWVGGLLEKNKLKKRRKK